MSAPGEDPRDDLAARNVHPVVRLPSAGLSGATIAGLCAVLAVILFLFLDANRRRRQVESAAGREAQALIVSPEPLPLPPAPMAPVRAEIIAPIPTETPPPPAPLLPPLRQASSVPPLSAPMQADTPPMPMPQPSSAGRVARGDGGSPLIVDIGPGDGLGNASTAASDDQAVRASIIRNRAYLVPQGSMISAVLETPIDSRRPGLVRAIVSRDGRGFDGTQILIPRGSRLIGEAGGEVKSGQKRVLVTWTRLIRPDGVAIRIGSPAADVLGGAGIRGKVNNHFLERFGNAVLQSALTIGVNVASRPRGNSVIVGLPGQIGATGQNLLPNVDSTPTIKVALGAEISVFVARDLDFSGTGARR